MKIVLIEFIEEFEAFRLFVRKNNLSLEDFMIIAFEPRLQAYLKKKGISYKNTLDYFDSSSHKRIIVETEKVMSYVRENFVFEDRNKLKNCYRASFMHYLRLYINHMFKMLEIFNNILIKHENCEFFAYIDKRFSSSVMIADIERYLGVLLKTFSVNNGLKFTNINKSIGFEPITKKINNPCIAIEKIAANTMLFFLRKKKIIFMPQSTIFFSPLIKRFSKKGIKIVCVAIYTGGLFKMLSFNLISFLKSQIKQNYCPCYVINLQFLHKTGGRQDQDRLLDLIDLLINPTNELLYEHNGVNYFNLLKQKVAFGLKGHMLSMLDQACNLSYLFRKIEKKIVVSYSALDTMGIAGELARRMGFKSLFISHGSHPVPVDSYHEIELLNLCKTFMLSDYTHVALSTPTQQQHLSYFKQRHPEIDSKELKIGPMFFAKINGKDRGAYRSKFGFSSDDIVLMHATTTKKRWGPRFQFIETLDEFFSSLTDIINIVNQGDRLKLIIRLHPGFYLSDDEIKSFLPQSDKFVIHRNGSFAEALSATDMLISYSSTAIDEALINKIPVLLYDKWKRYNHFNLDSCRDGIFPICYVDDQSKLGGVVQEMINKLCMVKQEEIDVSRYSYCEDYGKNFNRFIEQAL